MGLNSGAVVAGPLSPVDSRDTSATHQAQYGIGGHRRVADLTSMAAIPTERREPGMTVHVSSDSTRGGLPSLYRLREDMSAFDPIGGPVTPETLGGASGADCTSVINTILGAGLPVDLGPGAQPLPNGGSYNLSAAINITFGGASIRGKGKFASALLSTLGNHTLIQADSSSHAGFHVSGLQLGVAVGVTPTAGKLIDAATHTFADLSNMWSTNFWNGLHFGGGNNVTLNDMTLQTGISTDDGDYVATTAATTNGNQVIVVASAVGLSVGMYAFGSFIPNTPISKAASNTTITGISGNNVTLSGPATATLSGAAVKFSTKPSIYGYTIQIDASTKAFSNAGLSRINSFGRTGSVQTPLFGHVGYRITGGGTINIDNLISTKQEIGFLLEETSAAAANPNRIASFVQFSKATTEHANTGFVLRAFQRIKMVACEANLSYNGGYIIGADQNGNLSPLGFDAADYTLVGCSALNGNGHGFDLYQGNGVLIAPIVFGMSNPPGSAFGNNVYDGIHIRVSHASPYRIQILGGQSGGYSGDGSPTGVAISGTCPAAGSSSSIICPTNFPGGLNALAGMTLSVTAGTGAGQSILIDSSSTVQTSTTATTTATALYGSNQLSVASTAGINLGDKIFAAYVPNGSKVTAIDPVGNTVNMNTVVSVDTLSPTAVSFGAGNLVAVPHSTIAAPLDATSQISFTQLTQRYGICFDGDSTVKYDATIIGVDLRGNISGPLGNPGGAIITSGCVKGNTGIDDVVPSQTAASGVLPLGPNPTQIVVGTTIINKIVGTNGNPLPILQIPGTQITLLPDTAGHSISSVAGNNIANAASGSPGAPVTLTLDASGKYWVDVSKGISQNDTSYQFTGITTGGSLTLTDGVHRTILTTASGSIAAYTVVMPPNPTDGQEVIVTCNKAITALTVNANTGQSIQGMPTSLPLGSRIVALYRASNTTWSFS